MWLTASDENPNAAQVLFLADGAESGEIANYRLCVELFDGSDEQAVAAARRRWAAYKAAGHALTYFQQNDKGAWEEKATRPETLREFRILRSHCLTGRWADAPWPWIKFWV